MPITVTPAGSISLCRTNLENDYKNTLSWASVADQTSYFNNLPNKVSFTDYTYMKKDGKIRVGTPIDDIINYNYCYYNNGGFTTKRYYCFITRMEYVNENCTDVYIETDVFQTWYFDIIWNRCFVEREHVNNDSVGANTYPEGIETGEYTGNGDTIKNTDMLDYVYVMQVSKWATGTTKPLTTPVGGIPQAGGFYVFDSATALANVISSYGTGFAEAVKNVYLVPRWTLGIEGELTNNQWQGSISPLSKNDYVDMPTTLNGYTPRNKKLLCYPYQYITLFNGNGDANNLHYELFYNANHQCQFTLLGVPSVGGSVNCIPVNYKGQHANREEAILAGKFPTLSWSEDSYTNWLTQNAVNISSAIAGDTAQILIGAAMVGGGMNIGGAGNMAAGVVGISNTLGTIYQHSLVPNTLRGNTNGGDITTADGSNTFYYDRKSIKYEMAQKIDEYFDMFGYKVCRVKVPNITGRTNWNFIKTIDCNCDGNIPQEDLETIKRACNTGITFWHNPSNMYNYSLSNTIV